MDHMHLNHGSQKKTSRMFQKTKNQINETNKTPKKPYPQNKKYEQAFYSCCMQTARKSWTTTHHIYKLTLNAQFWKGNCSYPRHSGSLFGTPSEVEESKWPITAPL